MGRSYCGHISYTTKTDPLTYAGRPSLSVGSGVRPLMKGWLSSSRALARCLASLSRHRRTMSRKAGEKESGSSGGGSSTTATRKKRKGQGSQCYAVGGNRSRVS